MASAGQVHSISNPVRMAATPLQFVPILVPGAVLSHLLQDNLCASVFCNLQIHCTYSPWSFLTTLLSLRVRTLINQRNSGNAQSKLSPLSRRRIWNVLRRMSRSCQFRSPSPTISMQPLYAARLPVRISYQAKCIENPTWRTYTGGYEGHIFTGPHRLPTRDERHSRETPTAADAHDDGAGRLRLLRHCWIVLHSAVILCHV
ncbi:hypothetical protein M405DRAFT_825051 [Rhizopogon salebrosus TDB-379]|nr:hypothetical protein M405DRAFT_825051 [Rhizopogon salebrosus TDB-379]